jgi:acylphosphatase
MKNPIGQRLLISGRVQGVFYRRFAKNAAVALQVSGWTRNLPNGDVEVEAFGTEEQLTAYAEQLRIGPPLSKVKNILIQSIAWETHASFQIKA